MKKILSLFLIIASVGCHAQTITPEQAKDNIGKHITVCGIVKGVHTAKQTTFLNFGAAYPNQSFTAVIFSKSQQNFPNVNDYQNKEVCVTGTIKIYKGKPEIILERKDQLMVK